MESDNFGEDSEIEDEEDEYVTTVFQLNNRKGYIRKRQKARIIRFRNFGQVKETDDFYRENLMLYHPWRDEEIDIMKKTWNSEYVQHLQGIEAVKSQFDQRLDITSMEEEMNKVNQEEDLEEMEVDDEFQVMHDPDVEADFGIELGENKAKVEKFKMPNMLSKSDYDKLIKSLNLKQKKYHDHIVKKITQKSMPVCEFVSGGAGVGKSMLITAISQTIMLNAMQVAGKDPSRLKVLLCASTGVAAYNIQGYTNHQAFGLPFNQFNGAMPRLSESTRNRLAKEFQDVDLIIMDEVSMTSMEHLFQIDERLKQIFKSRQDFGGRSILVVGDFNQMEPVMAKWIFDEPTKGNNVIAGNQLWKKFRLFELTECMRQKHDIPFAEALNRLAIGRCNDKDIALFKSREIQNNGLVPPSSSIRLKYSNSDVSCYNQKVLDSLCTEGIISFANDRVQGRGNKEHHGAIRAAAKKLPLQKTQNLPLELKLKLSARYMMTVNCDTSDGLVNGAIGTLQKITYGKTKDGKTVPLKLWINFQKDVGTKLKARTIFRSTAEPNTWVPICQEKRLIHSWPGRNLEVVRSQFPFVPAEAITIHKSQGSTFKEVTVSIQYITKAGKLRTIPRRALYVAFSRCTSLSGLYIDGEFIAPDPPADDDKVIIAMQKLRERPVIFDNEDN